MHPEDEVSIGPPSASVQEPLTNDTQVASPPSPSSGLSAQTSSNPKPGNVTSLLSPREPISSHIPALPATSFLSFSEDISGWTYATNNGTFWIAKRSPALLVVQSTVRRTVLGVSTFTVTDGSRIAVPYAYNVTATDQSLRITYTLVYPSAADFVPIGTITLWVNLTRAGRDKITVLYAPSFGGDFWITWMSLTTDSFLGDGNDTLDFSSIQEKSLIWNRTSAAVGDGPTAGSWTRSLLFDWSDARAAALAVGKVALPDGERGSGLFITFGKNQKKIDPYLVATSSIPDATKYTHQRKVVFWDGYYYAFFEDQSGFDFNIRFRFSPDGKQWSQAETAAQPISDFGFDVAQMGSLVAVVWVDTSGPGGSMGAVWIAVGTLGQGSLTWEESAQVSGNVNVAIYSPSVAIGANGLFWVGWVDLTGPQNCAVVKYARSNNPFQAGPWTVKVSEPTESGCSYREALRPLSLSNGTMMLLDLMQGMGHFRYKTYDPFSDTLSPSSGWTNFYVTVATGADPGTLFSAVADEKDRVHIVYLGSDSNIYHISINSPGSCNLAISAAGSYPGSYPSVGLDAYKTLHVFWAAGTLWYAAGNFATDIFCPTFSAPSAPFGGNLNPSWVTAADHPVAIAPALFMKSDKSVNFAAMPAPTDLGPVQGSPWSRPGLSPYEEYFRNLDEAVSPGNGLLAVRQVDLSVPGRGLDLSVARTYVEPVIFGGSTPYLYEVNSFAPMGNGWQLDIPWVGPQYLHLWGGQTYRIDWNVDTTPFINSNGNIFENHIGEQFRLERKLISVPRLGWVIDSYVLSLPSGTTYTFYSDGTPNQITDPTGVNHISFSYASGLLSTVTDATGRTVQFGFANGKLTSISLGGKTIATYAYQGNVLASVTDAASRTTRFWYDSTVPGWLLKGIQYPTGGRSIYSYTANPIAFGTDLKGFPAVFRDVRDSTNVTLWTSGFSYVAVNGRIEFANVSFPGGSYMEYNYRHVGLYQTITRYASPRTQLGRLRIWSNLQGIPTQVDTYAGAASQPSFSTESMSDEWGNVIYTRDPQGHEQFLSFNDTSARNAFPGDGGLTRTTNGNLLYETFDFSGNSVPWHVTSGSVALDWDNFDPVPASLHLNATTSGAVASAYQYLSAGVSTGSLYADVHFKIARQPALPTQQATYEIDLIGSQATYIRAAVQEASTGFFILGMVSSSGAFQACPSSPALEPDAWHRLTIGVSLASPAFTLYLDGIQPHTGCSFSWQGLLGGDSINEIQARSTYSGGTTYASLWIDEVKVYRASTISVFGLRPDETVELSDTGGSFSSQSRASVASTGAVYIDLVAYDSTIGAVRAFEFGALSVKVYREDGDLEYASPLREVFGGDAYLYRAPLNSAPLSLVSSGFRKLTQIYIDDSTNLPVGFAPTTPTGSDPNPWTWSRGSRLLPLQEYGDEFHMSYEGFGVHSHGFTASTIFAWNCWWQPQSYAYVVQLIRLTAQSYPREVMLEFFGDTSPGSWEHRAFWGDDSIARGTTGTASRRNLGALPYVPDRWLMLIAPTDSTGVDVCSSGFSGQNFLLWGGNASWDVSALGGTQLGQVSVTGLDLNWKVELRAPTGNLVTYATVPASGQSGVRNINATLNLFAAGISAFPFRGYFQVYDASGKLNYTSPILNLFGGDVYSFSGTWTYTGPEFYPSRPPSNLLNAFLGQLASPLAGAYDPFLHIDMTRPTPAAYARPNAFEDVSFHGNHAYTYYGAAAGTLSSSPGVVARGGDFTAAGGPRLVVWPSPSLNVADEITISMWVEPRANPDCGPGYNGRTLLAKMPLPGEGAYGSYNLSVTDSRTLEFLLTVPGATGGLEGIITQYQLPVSSSAFTHLVFTRDVYGVIRFYANGSLAQSASGQAGRIASTSGPLYIGGGNDASACPTGGGSFPGYIDEVLLFPRALDANDVQILYRSELAGQTYVSQKTYFQWDPAKARIVESRAFHSDPLGNPSADYTPWITSRISYDAYGNIVSTTDPNGHVVSDSYSTFYGSAYATKTSETVSGRTVATQTTYDPNRGWRLSTILPNGLRIRYAYDGLGRLVNESYFTSLPSSTLLYYDMETPTDDATPRLQDLSGHGNAGTLTGTMDMEGTYGRARHFDPSHPDYVTAGDVADFPGTAPFTVSAWFRREADLTYWARILSKEKITSPREGWLLFIHAVGYGLDNRIGFERWTSGSYSYVYSDLVTVKNVWYHVAITYDGSTLRMYINGTFHKSAPSTNLLADLSASYPFRVGARSEDAGDLFQGGIDEVSIFTSALSDTDVRTLYNGATGLYASQMFQYDDVANTATTFDENGHKTRQVFDALGRLKERDRYDATGALYSYVNYTLDWRDLATGYGTDNRSVYVYTYDVLGRVTKVNNPGSSSRTLSYADGTLTRTTTATDEVGRKRSTEIWYATGATRTVSEWNPATSTWNVTSYGYDGVGRLISVSDPNGGVTRDDYDDLGRLVLTSFPDATTESYAYDNIGNLITKVDRGGRTSRYTYDEAGRLTTLSLFPTPSKSYSATFQYDIMGNLVIADNTTARVYLVRDILGRVTKESLAIDANNFSASYGYDKVGNTLYAGYPDGTNVSYAYDAFDRATDVKIGGAEYAALSYRKDDLVASVNEYNGGSTVLYGQSLVYDDRGRPLRISVSKGTTYYLDLKYTWNAASDVTQVVDAVAGTTETYTYDGQDRLSQATGPWGSGGAQTRLCYAYDAKGNWATKKEISPTSLCSTSTGVTYYVYDSAKKDDRLCGFDTSSSATCTSAATKFTYDALGQMAIRTSGSTTTTYTFDMSGLLVKLVAGTSTNSYAYDAFGRRVKAVEGSTTTYSVYGGPNVLYTLSGKTATDYVYASGLLVLRKSGSSVRSYHADHLGNVRLVTYWQSSNVQTEYSARYRPFGEVVVLTNKADPKFKFTGEWLDSSGLYYLRARYYDPTIGRFVSPDPSFGHLSRPQSLNRYAYVANNPLRSIDPSGQDDVPWWLDLVTLGLASEIPRTINWWNHASNAERWGFIAGILLAVAIGIAIGLSCVFAACAGLWLLAAGSAAFLGGAVGSSFAYIGVTRLLGGTPTQEGLSHAFYWGGWAGVAGFGVGQKVGFSILSGRALTADFPSPAGRHASIDDLFRKADHGADMGFSSPTDYLQGAQDFVSRGFSKPYFNSETRLYASNGDWIVYDSAKGEYGVYDIENNAVRTYLQPSAPNFLPRPGWVPLLPWWHQ